MYMNIYSMDEIDGTCMNDSWMNKGWMLHEY